MARDQTFSTLSRAKITQKKSKLNQRLDASAPAFSKEDMREMESAHGHPPPPHALTRGYQNGGGDVV
jgi:hypothetical protein